MSETNQSKRVNPRPLLEGYQPTDGKGCDPVTGKLDLRRLKPPKWTSAVQPPPGTAPSQPPPKPPSGEQPSS